jgi:small nuclear ribonucleoprotein (snRNP)-like protein
MSMETTIPPSGNPLDKIEHALDKRIYIKLKGRRAIMATLRSFDEHLNLFLEETVELTHHYDQEKKMRVEGENELDSIILRGDNVIFLTLDELPVYETEPAPVEKNDAGPAPVLESSEEDQPRESPEEDQPMESSEEDQF